MAVLPKTRRFQKANDPFLCLHCQKKVPPAGKTSRNHCPFCLHSRHVDHFPGDRANPCQGLLAPFAYEGSGGKISIWFECQSCGFQGKNRALLEDPYQADDFVKILALSGKSPSRG